MENEEFFDVLSKNINYIIINSNIISGGTFDIKMFLSKYSSMKNKSLNLFHDGTLIRKKNTIVNYKCETCGKNYTILLKKYLLKNNFYCWKCKEHTVKKRTEQSNYMIKTYLNFNKVVPKMDEIKIKINNSDLINISNLEFNKETDEFKMNYYSKHLTIEEYLKIKKDIYSINGCIDFKDMIYYDHIKIKNQMRYSSYLYDDKNDIFINLNNIKYTCDNCDSIFKTTRKPIERLSNTKCFCKRCLLSNKIFKIKNIINCKGDKVTYQSLPELDLINQCNNKNIVIKNGPIVEYFFREKMRKYHIDYYIPSHKLLIEIKDNHIWHKNQIDNGQWFLKEQSAKKFAKENNLIYKLIFTQYLKDFLNTF